MTHLRHLLHSKNAKTNYGLILVVVAVAAVAVFGFDKGWFDNIDLPFSVGDNTSGDLASRKIQFSFTDKYDGGALASDTFYVYDGVSHSLLELLTTDSDGVKVTAKSYTTGKTLDILYHTGNALVWYPLTVPGLSEANKENTYFTIDYEAFGIGTYTADTLRTGATNLADNDIWNVSDNSAPIFTYELANTGNDNTGLMNSVDPVYGQNLRVCIVATFTGTGYEHVIPQGFDSVFTLGSTTYGVSYFSPEALTKWKVGPGYMPGYQGSDTVSFSLDLTGIVEADDVTAQITAYAYADADYAMSHGGSVGNSEVTIAEQTIVIDDGP